MIRFKSSQALVFALSLQIAFGAFLPGSAYAIKPSVARAAEHREPEVGQDAHARPEPFKAKLDEVSAENSRIAKLQGWLKGVDSRKPLVFPDKATTTEAFLETARKNKGKIIIGDELNGMLTYRDMIMRILIMKKRIEALPGDRVGIMLPASVTGTVLYYAALFAGKTPVMVNFTLSGESLKSSLNLAGVEHVLTSDALVKKLEKSQDLSAVKDRFVSLEGIKASISKWEGLTAKVKSYLSWSELKKVKMSADQTTTILFSSGSSGTPGGIPLSHENQLTNAKAIAEVGGFTEGDRFFGFLPAFHSFGSTVTQILTVCLGVPTFYYPDPTQGGRISRLIEQLQASHVAGTPHFLKFIFKKGSAEQLKSLRVIMSGAAKLNTEAYALIESKNSTALVLEGYGLTEASPTISSNTITHNKRGTVGRALPGVETLIVDPETLKPVAQGQQGRLLVRGKSIFKGYLGEKKAAFVETEGKRWLDTQDIFSIDAEGYLTIHGRLSRFIKNPAGEMIPIDLLEGTLQNVLGAGQDIAVIAVDSYGPLEDQKAVVFSTDKTLDLARAKRILLDQGVATTFVSSVGKVVAVDEIPMLGSGKPNYVGLKLKLAE